MQPKQVVHHGLVGPLHQQRRDRVVAAVHQQQHRPAAPPKQLAALLHDIDPHGLRKQLTHFRVFLVADDGLALQGEEAGNQAVGHLADEGAHVRLPARGDARLDVEGEQLRRKREDVCVEDLHLPHHLVVIRIRQRLQLRVLERVGEEQVVLCVQRGRQLLGKDVDVLLGGPHKHEGAQVGQRVARLCALQLLKQEYLLGKHLTLGVHQGHDARRVSVQQQNLHARHTLGGQKLVDVVFDRCNNIEGWSPRGGGPSSRHVDFTK
mmetsp:Transcript_16320/g.41842  ORF Transcript_16320/g.41842 Transcript_16320/m.41842 type:complete len:264 (-) Transcript_16320:105-896(-)